MSPMTIIGILLALLIYIVFILYMIKNKGRHDEVTKYMNVDHESKVFTFNFELELINKFNLKPEKIKPALWIERIIIVSIATVVILLMRGLGLALILAIAISFIFYDLYKRELYKSGITTVPKVTNFLDFFVPHINSGNSADQSFLAYIDYAKDIELAEYFEKKDDPAFVIKPHLKQIIEIYDIAKYNEAKGISQYTYILNEISADITQKQTYYNQFIARIGEIKPIEWSYYLGVPILILVSYSSTQTFWQGGYGWIVAFCLVLFFGLFKFLIFKLQRKTIHTIF